MPWGSCGCLGRASEPAAYTGLDGPDSDLPYPLVMTLEVSWSQVSFGHAEL